LELIYLFGQKAFIDGLGRELMVICTVGEPHKVLCFCDCLSGKQALGLYFNSNLIAHINVETPELLNDLDPLIVPGNGRGNPVLDMGGPASKEIILVSKTVQ
jgi:hypothetical protein